MQHLQKVAFVVPTHRAQARFPVSQQYDFWRDPLNTVLEVQRIDMVIIAANMAYETALPPALFESRVIQLVQACQFCRVIYISSDGIFDGKKGQYTEQDIPTPTMPYGRNLYFFEEHIRTFCANHCIIRPSYLYGYAFSQLDRRLAHTQNALLAGEQLNYFSNMFKSPMEVNQVAQAITELALSGYVGTVHVAGERMSVYAFHRDAMQRLKVPCERLLPALMPEDCPYPRDTSLATYLLEKLTAIEPLTVDQALFSQG